MLGGIILAAPLAAHAQHPKRVPTIGLLARTTPSTPGITGETALEFYRNTFLKGLRELGYVEGQNIAVEYRWAEGQDERFPGLAAELVRLSIPCGVRLRTRLGRWEWSCSLWK